MRAIGLEPDPSDSLHKRVVIALRSTGGAPLGDQLVALQFAFNGELLSAGREWADAKSKYENHVKAEATRLRREEHMSATAARLAAEGAVDALEMRRRELVAEKREQAIRKYLDTFQSAMDNHRTNRADWRAVDTFHAQTGAGES
jgi:hypothetical protein